MIEINFKKRRTKPTNPIAGSFYWVESNDNPVQIWFSPTDSSDDLILLNENAPIITEEDIEKIVEMVNSKTINLKWTII